MAGEDVSLTKALSGVVDGPSASLSEEAATYLDLLHGTSRGGRTVLPTKATLGKETQKVFSQ